MSLVTAPLFALLCAASLAAPAVAQQTAAPTFGDAEPAVEAGSLLTMSDDKKTLIVSFSGLEIEIRDDDSVGLVNNSPSVATEVFSLSLPIERADQGVKVHLVLEGAVDVRTGIDASVIATVNGEPHAMDFRSLVAGKDGFSSDGCRNVSPEQKAAALKRAAERRANAGQKTAPKSAGEIVQTFLHCAVLNAPSASDLRVNVALLIARRDEVSDGYINVTSLDAIIQPQGK